MRAIIMEQKAAGFWLPRNIGSIKQDEIKNTYPTSLLKNDSDSMNIWFTAVVIVYLMNVFAGEKDNWNLVVEKARKWIRKEEKKIGSNQQ